jgi:hypothetical protein
MKTRKKNVYIVGLSNQLINEVLRSCVKVFTTADFNNDSVLLVYV